MKKTKSEKMIGIDLGTTFSVVCHINQAGIPEVIPCHDGRLKYPSIVSFASEKPVAGADAKNDLILSPEFVVKCGKRHMGKESSPGKPIPLLKDSKGRQITAVDASAVLLNRLRDSAQNYLGCEVTKAVITVPAYFKEVAINHTVAAAKIAGFQQVKTVTEPMAAALFYGLEKQLDEVIVVFDYGGGTLDIAGLEVVKNEFKTLVVDGNCKRGGENYDQVVLDLMIREGAGQGISIDPKKDLADCYQNLERAREAKESLAQRESTTVIIEAGGKRCKFELDRKMFARHTRHLDNEAAKICESVMKKLGEMGKKPTRVIKVGGSSRLVNIDSIIKDIFKLEPSQDTDPDLIVGRGAAIWAHKLFTENDMPLFLGGRQYLPSDIKAATVTAHEICVAAITDKDNHKEYNVGIVPANTALPMEFEERFSPLHPMSSGVTVKIMQGKEGQLSSESTLLRRLDVPITPSRKKDDRIIVKGSYSEDGLLDITAWDKIKNCKINDSFIYSAGLSSEQIEQKAEEFKARMEE